MKINISKIYTKIVLNNYNYKNKEEFEKDFTSKQKNMWSFTLGLLKDNYPQKIYDDVCDNEYLSGYLNIHLANNSTPFTLQEWFEYLKSME